MKYVLTLFVLTMSLQPLQLQSCTMDADQVAPHHAAMQDEGGHDCCDTESEATTHACNDMAPCGSCSLGISLAAPGAGSLAVGLVHQYLVLDDGRYTSPVAHPLIRPPIS